jgi:replicative DNA helicase
MSTSFSKDEQSAILGHAIQDDRIFLLANELGIKTSWFTQDAKNQALWKALVDFWVKHKRHPTFAEFLQADCLTKIDPNTAKFNNQALDAALEGSTAIGSDVIVPALKAWASDELIRKCLTDSANSFNKQDNQSEKILLQLSTDLERIKHIGINARIDSATNRVKNESVLRKANASNRLEFGIEYLDDALLGIGQHDVFVFGGSTGIGKTQLATLVAAHNCIMGKKVAYLALEAEESEIERRIKYSVLSRMYRAKYNKYAGSFIQWDFCKLDDRFAEFELACMKEFEDKYSNLTTLYRLHGDYGIEELEKDIMRLSKDNDLLIIDHLQYIDTGDVNENAGVKEIVKRLRDLALLLSKPIILISHVRKETGPRRQAPLTPTLDDLHGSSDIQKIATGVIMLARARDFGESVTIDTSGLNPTFIRIAKARKFGGLEYYGAVSFYDSYTGGFKPGYAIGEFKDYFTKFEPMATNQSVGKIPPVWAKHATVQLNKIKTEGDKNGK